MALLDVSTRWPLTCVVNLLIQNDIFWNEEREKAGRGYINHLGRVHDLLHNSPNVEEILKPPNVNVSLAYTNIGLKYFYNIQILYVFEEIHTSIPLRCGSFGVQQNVSNVSELFDGCRPLFGPFYNNILY